MKTLFIFALAVATLPAWGSDAYLLRFSAHGQTAPCHQARWNDNVLLYNQNDGPATIQLLGISNGTLPAGSPNTFTIAPHEATSLSHETRNYPWAPTPFNDQYMPFNDQYIMWVIHVDVPSGVTVESRDEVTDTDICTPERIFNGTTAKISMPVVRNLIPANVTQVKLGTDIGSTPARQNVAIYNGGASVATAAIELRSACDNHLIEERTVSVPANSIVQYAGFATGPADCTGNTEIAGWTRYMLVTVDQPSFTVISTVTEAQQQAPGNILPLVELASSISSTF